MDATNVTYLEVHNKFSEIKEYSLAKKKEYVVEYLVTRFRLNESKHAKNILMRFMRRRFFPKYLSRWNQSSRTDENFKKTYESRLQQELKFPPEVYQYLPLTPGEYKLLCLRKYMKMTAIN